MRQLLICKKEDHGVFRDVYSDRVIDGCFICDIQDNIGATDGVTVYVVQQQ